MDSRRRSAFKALTWRVAATSLTTLIAYLVTGSISIAGQVGALDFVLKFAAYYLHERAYTVDWTRVGGAMGRMVGVPEPEPNELQRWIRDGPSRTDERYDIGVDA